MNWNNTWIGGVLNWVRRGNYRGPIEFSTLNAEIFRTSFENNNDYREILNKCSLLASVIYNRADAFAMGDVQVLSASTGNDVRGANKDWLKLIERPNFMQTKTEFLKQLHVYLDVMGWCYAMPIYPAGFTDRPSAIWLLPPWAMSVQAIQKPFYSFTSGDQVRKVYFNYAGQRVELNEQELILFTDSNSPICEYTMLPEGRVKSLEYPITKLISAEEAGVSMIQKRGPIGILGSDSKDAIGSMPIKPEEKKAIQEDFGKYGLSRSQWQIIVSNAAVRWNPIGFDFNQLGLSESYLQAAKDVCERYNYPFILASHSDQTTYNNIPIADRRLFQNGIMPTAAVIFEQLNAGLKTTDNNVKIAIDYSKVPALQATEKDKADALVSQNNAMQALYQRNLVTKNQWLEYIGWNKVADPEFDKYYYQTAEYQNQTSNAGN